MIGAGAAGLVAARELVREGHQVQVFEKGSCTGGVWVYTDDVESPDLLGELRLLGINWLSSQDSLQAKPCSHSNKSEGIAQAVILLPACDSLF